MYKLILLLAPPKMVFFAIFFPFVANTTVLGRQRPAWLREVLRSSHESVHATISIQSRQTPITT